jgi:hypothetical protein
MVAMATARVDAALRRLKDIFLEYPRRSMTSQDAACAASVDVEMCGILLEALTDARFLRPCGAGTFVCATTDDL